MQVSSSTRFCFSDSWNFQGSLWLLLYGLLTALLFLAAELLLRLIRRPAQSPIFTLTKEPKKHKPIHDAFGKSNDLQSFP